VNRAIQKAFFAALVLSAVGLAVVWGPASVRRARALENTVALAVASRDVHVSPAELATLMHNRQVALAIFDLRDEAAYNWFHILDARRVTTKDLARVRALPDRTVKMLIAQDERTATEAYRALAVAGTKQVYVLAGGIGAWLELFGRGHEGRAAVLAGAWGERHPASDPDVEHTPLPKFDPRIKLMGSGAKKASGGCGG
jgi:rhodanese-related sulfurtransferase